MKKKVFIGLFFSLHSMFLISQSHSKITLTVDAFEGKPSVLYSIKGSRYLPLDTVKISNGKAQFLLKAPLPKGLYTISLNDSLSVEFISEDTDIEMQTALPDLVSNMNIIKSGENKVYYDYLKYYNYAYDSAMRCKSDADMIKAINGGTDTYQSKELRGRTENIMTDIRQYTKKLADENQDLFVSKILTGGLIPDYNEYRLSPNAVPYNNIMDYYREHFFDNIDFADSNLLRTKIIFIAVTDYITNFADPPSSESYITTIDFILEKASINLEVHKYLLDLLTVTFGSSPFEDVYVHLVDNYHLKNACGTEAGGAATYTERAEAMKNLEIGKQSPAIDLPGPDGKTKSLYDVKANYTLLFFWNTSCTHCETAVSELKKIYDKYRDKGFEIFAFAIAYEKNSWISAIEKQSSPWLNVSDIKGNQSPLMTLFNLWSTPSYFLLDKNKKIIDRPSNPESISRFLKAAYNF